MIELRRVSRTYGVGGQAVHALRDLDLHIAAGEYVSIMGPSGSGKSTLLNLLGCLDRPTAGSYLLDGEEVARLDDADLTRVRRHKVGFIFQSFHLVSRLTALGNVELPMMFAGAERAERQQRAARALESVGLAARRDHRPDQLSGGEQQRVAIARAMVMEPEILLADEPTGNLDTASGDEVVRLLEKMNAAGLTLIVVTHDPEIAHRAGRQLGLVDGRLARDVRRDAAGPPGGPS